MNKKKRNGVLLIIGIIAAAMVVSLVFVLSQGVILQAREDIAITRDGEFSEENGVVSGSGTTSNPYIISGWEVESIIVKDTSKHFVIQDCSISTQLLVEDAAPSTCTIRRVESIDKYPDDVVVLIQSSDGTEISECVFSNWLETGEPYDQTNRPAVKIVDSIDVSITSCDFYGDNVDIFSPMLAFGSGCEDAFVSHCIFDGYWVGIYMLAKGFEIEYSIFDNNFDEGIFVLSEGETSNSVIHDCSFYDDAPNIEFRQFTGRYSSVEIYNNEFRGVIDFFDNHLPYPGKEFAFYIHDNEWLRDAPVAIQWREYNNEGKRQSGFKIWDNDFDVSYAFSFLSSLASTGHPIDHIVIYHNHIEASNYCFRFSSPLISDVLIYDNEFIGKEFRYLNTNIFGSGYASNFDWFIPPVSGTNIVGGPNIGGNYWSQHICVDSDNDGFCDQNYLHDYYPLYIG